MKLSMCCFLLLLLKYVGVIFNNTICHHTGLELKEVDGKEIYAGLYSSIVIPSLNVGTIGGGVGLATQRECLKLIGCNGKVCEQCIFLY